MQVDWKGVNVHFILVAFCRCHPALLDAKFLSLSSPPLTPRVGAEKEKQRVGRMHCNDFQSCIEPFNRAGIPPLPPLSLIFFDQCQTY